MTGVSRSMKPKISIVICTKDRADSLKLTPESIKQTKVSADFPVELLVVDNGSTDHTEQVVQTADFPHMRVKYLCEPRIGKSHAYNTAISIAAGEILLCTDDDVRVPAHWIEGMCRPIFQSNADAVAGGVVFPPHIEALFENYPQKNRRGWFASTHELDPQKPGRMVGANMAFHRRVIDKVPAFDVELGPGPEVLGNFEDTMFS
jgi:glycosyltransferase involved in cell wall biosynthesis